LEIQLLFLNLKVNHNSNVYILLMQIIKLNLQSWHKNTFLCKGWSDME